MREAVRPLGVLFDHPLKGRQRPAGWSCFVESSPSVVKTTAGILDCLLFKRDKIIGSFSAGPDFTKQ